jgi:hypothetical protein
MTTQIKDSLHSIPDSSLREAFEQANLSIAADSPLRELLRKAKSLTPAECYQAFLNSEYVPAEMREKLKTKSLTPAECYDALLGLASFIGSVKEEVKKIESQQEGASEDPDYFANANVRVYGMVGLWSLTNAQMRNIDAIQDVQASLMSLQVSVETLASDWSNYWIGILETDDAKVQFDADPNNNKSWTDQQRATAVSADTNQYNYDATQMQTFSSFYSAQNNLLSNGVANAGQALSVDGSTIQEVVMTVMNALAQILGSI